MVLELIWAGDRSGLLRKAQRGRLLEEECCEVEEIELVTSIGKFMMVKY